MKKADRLKTLREISPLFWYSYQHMFDTREGIGQSNINFLLVVSTFLPIFCVTLFTTDMFRKEIILIPVVFQFTALLILIQSFFIKVGRYVHWFDLNDDNIIKSIENDEFELNLICDLKDLENGTWENMLERNSLIRKALYLIIFSIFSTALSISFVLLNGDLMLYIIVLMISAFFIFLYKKYHAVKEPESGIKKRDQYYHMLKNWIDKK